MRHKNKTLVHYILLLLFLFVSLPGQAYGFPGKVIERNPSTKADKKIRLFIIGNSFSINASKFLPDLARERGHELIIGRAELGGCSLQRHWEIVEFYEANSQDPKGRQYKGKSLKMLLSEENWDIVTMQQNSMNSTDPETYQPYATNLYNYIKKIVPQAEVVLHQTWAYRTDAKTFGQIQPKQHAQSAEEMYLKSRSAYQSVAADLGVRLLPVGNAFWQINSHPKWSYQKDESFNFDNSVPPALPIQTNSLHAGYYWNNEKKLALDANHANAAGEYLGSLVWYACLFKEAPTKLKFVAEGISQDFAHQLKKTAKKATKSLKKETIKS